MEAHWPMQSPLARHAAAADLWMELTGRKPAAVLDVAKEAMVKHAGEFTEAQRLRSDFRPSGTAKAAAVDVSALRAWVRAHPRAAAGAGAALLGAPAGIAGFMHERSRHVAGQGGKSKFEIDAETDLAKHRALGEHAGTASRTHRLKDWFLSKKMDAATEARENPTRAAAFGAIPYTVLTGALGSAFLPRLLQ